MSRLAGPSYLTIRSSVCIILIWDPCIRNLHNLCQTGSSYIPRKPHQQWELDFNEQILRVHFLLLQPSIRLIPVHVILLWKGPPKLCIECHRVPLWAFPPKSPGSCHWENVYSRTGCSKKRPTFKLKLPLNYWPRSSVLIFLKCWNVFCPDKKWLKNWISVSRLDSFKVCSFGIFSSPIFRSL